MDTYESDKAKYLEGLKKMAFGLGELEQSLASIVELGEQVDKIDQDLREKQYRILNDSSPLGIGAAIIGVLCLVAASHYDANQPTKNRDASKMQACDTLNYSEPDTLRRLETEEGRYNITRDANGNYIVSPDSILTETK